MIFTSLKNNTINPKLMEIKRFKGQRWTATADLWSVAVQQFFMWNLNLSDGERRRSWIKMLGAVPLLNVSTLQRDNRELDSPKWYQLCDYVG